MQVIIMCGGTYRFDPPKQFTRVLGERLIDRTVRLLQENGIDDIKISSGDPRFDIPGTTRLVHENEFDITAETGYWVDAFYPTNKPTIYLFGDVYYSDAAVRMILNAETDYVLFFGSKNVRRPDCFKKWQEPFAFKVVDQHRFRIAIEQLKILWDEKRCGRHPISWELYRILNGYDVNMHIMDRNFVSIDDYTTDIDEPEDRLRLEEMLR